MRRWLLTKQATIAMAWAMSGVVVGGVPASEPGHADDPGTSQRIYLLSTPGRGTFYSPDLHDPELGGSSLSQRCNVFLNPQTNRICQYTFLPAMEWIGAPSWSDDAPLRFRLALRPDLPAGGTVHLFVQQGGRQVESPPATETAPGIWEGSLRTAVAFDPDAVLGFGARVRGAGPTVALQVDTGGRSWVELPAPVAVRAVPELLRRSPAPPGGAPVILQTGDRRFVFNDGDWRSWRFNGDLAAARTFSLSLDRPAAALYAWLEPGREPAAHALAGGRSPDPYAHSDRPSLVVRHDGAVEGDGGNAARAVRSLAPGTVDVTVSPNLGAQGAGYTVWVVAVHGERSLASMRWRGSAGTATAGSGAVSVCPHTFEPVVTSRAVSTFTVRIVADGALPGGSWVPGFDLPTYGSFVCPAATSDPQARIVLRRDRIWLFDPVTTGDDVTLDLASTVLTWEARFAYDPVPG